MERFTGFTWVSNVSLNLDLSEASLDWISYSLRKYCIYCSEFSTKSTVRTLRKDKNQEDYLPAEESKKQENKTFIELKVRFRRHFERQMCFM